MRLPRPQFAVKLNRSSHVRSLCSRAALVRRSTATRNDALMTPEQRAVQVTRTAERRRFGLPVMHILGGGLVGVCGLAWWFIDNQPQQKVWSGLPSEGVHSLQAHHPVRDQQDVEALLSQVRIVLGRHGIGLGRVPLRVRMLTDEELRLHGGVVVEGTTHRVVRPPPALRGVESVGLKPGLTAVHAAQVLAHEYAHCWLWLQGFPPLEHRLEEGLCELISYLFLLSCLNEPLAEGAALVHDEAALRHAIHAIEANAHPDYGNGFRECVEALRGRALHDLLGYVRQNARLPPAPGIALLGED